MLNAKSTDMFKQIPFLQTNRKFVPRLINDEAKKCFLKKTQEDEVRKKIWKRIP